MKTAYQPTFDEPIILLPGFGVRESSPVLIRIIDILPFEQTSSPGLSPVRGGMFIGHGVLIPLFLKLRRSGMALRMTERCARASMPLLRSWGRFLGLMCYKYAASNGAMQRPIRRALEN